MSSDHLKRRQIYYDTRRQIYYDTRRQIYYDTRNREREIAYDETLGQPGRRYIYELLILWSYLLEGTVLPKMNITLV